MHILHFLSSLRTLSQKNLKHWGLCAPELVGVELDSCMERFLAFPQFPVCSCRKWYQAFGSLISVEPEALKAVNSFLSAGKSCPFSLHESAADSELLHGTPVYPLHKKRLCWCFKLLFVKPEHNKILLVSSDPPSQRSVPFEQETLPKENEFPKWVPGEGEVLTPPGASSQTLWWPQGHQGAWDSWGFFVVWVLGFLFFFSQQNYPSILQGAKWHRVNIVQQ